MSQSRAEPPKEQPVKAWGLLRGGPTFWGSQPSRGTCISAEAPLGPGLPLEVEQQPLLLRAHVDATHGAYVLPRRLEFHFAGIQQVLVGTRVVFLNEFNDVVNQW